MKRRSYGVNLDDGIPLLSKEDFQLLYVNTNQLEKEKLQDWLSNNNSEPVMLGGQIGSGKTTLLVNILRDIKKVKIRFSFDTGVIEPTFGGFTLHLFGKILQECLSQSISIKEIGITILDFEYLNIDDWESVAHKIISTPESLKEADALQNTVSCFFKKSKFVLNACGLLLERLKKKIKHPPLLIADGVDKYSVDSPEYFSIKEVLLFLARRKTLFEVNAIHLFLEKDFKIGIEKIFIGALDTSEIIEIMTKRLGAYSTLHKVALPRIAEYSGGNIRQALRLLNYYYFYYDVEKNIDKAMNLATQRVIVDMLSLPYKAFPEDIFNVIKRDGYMEAGLFSSQSTVSEISDIVYCNWIFIKSIPTPVAPMRWPTKLNPLIAEFIDAVAKKENSSSSSSSGEVLIQNWAKNNAMTSVGINAPVDEYGKPDWQIFWKQLEESIDSKKMNLIELLENIANGLFGIQRQDRIIVAYENPACLKPVRDFLIGEAYTFDEFECEEIILTGGEGKYPISKLSSRILKENPYKIYSIELSGNWTEQQLRELDAKRDIFINIQMLWWIRKDKLKEYLHFWPQLRQMFRIYQLEENLLFQNISREEIEEDIELIKELSEAKDNSGIKRLQNVLEYLAKEGGVSNGS